jgi:tripartite-type tricarboxylate transporter receptor subunit TctC
MMQRRALIASALAAPAILRTGRVRAQGGWQPTRPIQLVLGFAAGGGSDVIARTIVAGCQHLYPQPLVILNRPGAGGTLAAQQVAAAPPDGYTLLLGGGSESTSVPAHREVPYDPKRSFTSIIRLTRHNQFVTVRGDGPYQTLADIVAAAKANPGRIGHGSSGVGTLAHSLALLFGRKAEVRFRHVPYQGGAPALQALVAGQIDFTVAGPDEMRGLIEAGRLRIVGVASPERAPGYPEVPTLREQGFDVVVENMKGWVAPAGLPEEIVRYHHDRMREGMQSAAWRDFIARARESDGYASGPDFQRAMDTLLDEIRAALQATA